jgi:prepilin-type N-terminal cleavage/methylation domain-containing protein
MKRSGVVLRGNAHSLGFNHKQGFTLIELLVVVGLMAGIAMMSISLLDSEGNQQRYDTTEHSWRLLRSAIVGGNALPVMATPVSIGGASAVMPTRGFLSDMGRPPAVLDELLVRPADCNLDGTADDPCPLYQQDTSTGLFHGWAGPYITALSTDASGSRILTDGWGHNWSYQLASGQIHLFSLGKGNVLDSVSPPAEWQERDFPFNSNDQIILPSWMVSGGHLDVEITPSQLTEMACSERTLDQESCGAMGGACFIHQATDSDGDGVTDLYPIAQGIDDQANCSTITGTALEGHWQENRAFGFACDDPDYTDKASCQGAGATWSFAHGRPGFSCWVDLDPFTYVSGVTEDPVTSQAECDAFNARATFPLTWLPASQYCSPLTADDATSPSRTGCEDASVGTGTGVWVSKGAGFVKEAPPLCLNIAFIQNGLVTSITSHDSSGAIETIRLAGTKTQHHRFSLRDSLGGALALPVGQWSISLAVFDESAGTCTPTVYPSNGEPILVSVSQYASSPMIRWPKVSL